MQTINIHEAKTHFSRFVERAEAGEEIVIARAGKPVARLVPLTGRVARPRKLGLGSKKYTFPDDFEGLNATEIEGMFEQGR